MLKEKILKFKLTHYQFVYILALKVLQIPNCPVANIVKIFGLVVIQTIT